MMDAFRFLRKGQMDTLTLQGLDEASESGDSLGDPNASDASQTCRDVDSREIGSEWDSLDGSGCSGSGGSDQEETLEETLEEIANREVEAAKCLLAVQNRAKADQAQARKNEEEDRERLQALRRELERSGSIISEVSGDSEPEVSQHAGLLREVNDALSINDTRPGSATGIEVTTDQSDQQGRGVSLSSPREAVNQEEDGLFVGHVGSPLMAASPSLKTVEMDSCNMEASMLNGVSPVVKTNAAVSISSNFSTDEFARQFKESITDAGNAYTHWLEHKDSNDHDNARSKVEKGWFSWLRHNTVNLFGESGKRRKENIQKLIDNSATSLATIAGQIKYHLEVHARNNHSLNLYFMDALQGLRNEPLSIIYDERQFKQAIVWLEQITTSSAVERLPNVGNSTGFSMA